MPSPGSRVTIIAEPIIYQTETKKIPVTDLVFTWSKDGKTVNSASGQGKNELSFTAGNAGDQSRIEVEITSKDRRQQASAAVSIPIQPTKILLYEYDPLLGHRFEKAIGSGFNLSLPEITFNAEPYYFSQTEVRAGKLVYDWRRNGEKVVSNSDQPQQITLIAPKQGQGENQIELTVQNPQMSQQNSRASLLIKFGVTNFNFWFMADGVQLLVDLPGTDGKTASLTEYLTVLFPLFIQLSALLAIIVIAYNGLEYIFGKLPGGKGQAKNRIWTAVGGLALALAAWLILNTINPELTKNQFLIPE